MYYADLPECYRRLASPLLQIDDRTPLVAAVLADGKLCWFVQRGAGCEALDLAAPLPARWLHDTFTLLRCHLPVRLDVFGVRVHFFSVVLKLRATTVLLPV